MASSSLTLWSAGWLIVMVLSVADTDGERLKFDHGAGMKAVVTSKILEFSKLGNKP